MVDIFSLKSLICEAFNDNLATINSKQRDKILSKTIEVYPKNKEEMQLLEMVLKKMGIGFALR
ncbi:MAG: hypothetical protein AB8G11_18860 [Saprospiraceae bacterium]